MLIANRSGPHTVSRSRRLCWLSAAALVTPVLAAAPAVAQATRGGAGGSSQDTFANGGASSATAVGNVGANAPIPTRGGGGGGAGTLGGAGGSDSTGAAPGGSGGIGPGANGLSGQSGFSIHSGGGGGGGAHGAVVTTDTSNSAALSGGNGGRGGATTGDFGGGGGGAGGYGVVVDGNGLTYSNGSSITGGKGGNGGAAASLNVVVNGWGGNGGQGGYGIFLTGSSVVLNNAGTIKGGGGGNGGDAPSSTQPNASGDGGSGAAGVAFAAGGTLINSGTITGGDAGVAGATDTSHSGTAGTAGAGVIGANLAIINSGTISRGNGFGLFAAPAAISFTGGSNVLEIWASSIINGNVVGTGTDTFRLGGAANGSFDVSTIGATAQFQGFSSFVKTGTATWTLAGTTTAVTPWSINQGALAVSSDANLGDASGSMSFGGGTLQYLAGFSSSRTVTLNAGGGTFDTNGNNATLSGTISGTGGLTKVGVGILTLSGTSSYTGATTIDGGVLDVEGAITNTSGVTVNAGGTLTGAGLVDPPMTVGINAGGTLAPGNGTAGSSMTIVGNLAFQSGAYYLVQLDPTTASFASVTGTATLGGATVNAVFGTGGGYIDKRYTILTTSGGISGGFGSVVKTNLPSGFKTSLSYDANNVYLDLILAFAVPGGLNGNQKTVGDTLSAFFDRTGDIPVVFGKLNQAGLTQASGESATGVQQTTFNAMSQFASLLTDPFAQRQASGGSAISYADTSRKRTDAFAMLTDDRPADFAQRWNVWAAGFGGSQTTSGNAVVGSNDTTSRIAGTAVGADYRIAPRTIAGFALGGGGTSFSVNGLGSGRSDLFQAGAYLHHHIGPSYLRAALAYGWQDVTADRTVTISGVDRLRATYQANAWIGRIEGGTRFVAPIGGIGLTPYAAAQVTSLRLPAYVEQAISGTSTFALSYTGKTVTDTRTEFGLRTDKSYALADGALTLRGRLAWAHDFNPDRSVAATFQTLPGASFVVNGAAQARDSALTTTSVEMSWQNGWSAMATFEGEFSSVTRSYAGKGSVRYSW